MINSIKNYSRPGIYAIVNKINNKMYIGKSINIYKRVKQHITWLNTKNRNENRYLINSWHKYGKDNFEIKILEFLELNEDLLSQRELYWMKYYNTVDLKFGYNLRMDSSTKMIVHKETRLLMSNVHKERISKWTEEDRKNHGKLSIEFWENNPDIKLQMSKKVSDVNRKYNIIQYDRDMNFIKEYKGRYDIVNNYPDLYVQAILGVCNGTKASYKNSIWRYKDLKTGKIIKQKSLKERKENSKFRKSNKISIFFDGNNFIEYPYLKNLCDYHNLSYSNIHHCLKSKDRYNIKNTNQYVFYK